MLKRCAILYKSKNEGMENYKVLLLTQLSKTASEGCSKLSLLYMPQ
jgi:hypothetical protein